MRVLVAEDDPVALEVMKKRLTSQNHEVIACENGQTALEALSADDSPKVAILDWMMPYLSGIEVCRHLVEMNLKSNRYIIMCSANNEPEQIVEGLLAGADDYMTKPVDKSQLLARLKVAERIVSYWDEMHQAAARMEEIIRRHNLLGEMMSRHAAGGKETAPKKPSVEVVEPQPQKSSEIETGNLHVFTAFRDVMRATLERVGLKNPSSEPEYDQTLLETPEPVCAGWLPMALGDQYWVDLIIESKVRESVTIAQRALNVAKAQAQQVLDAYASMAAMGQHIVGKHFAQENVPVRFPLMPTSMMSRCFRRHAKLSLTRNSCAFEFDKMVLNCHLIVSGSPWEDRPLGKLQAHDVLWDPIRGTDPNELPDAKKAADEGIALMPAGTVLNFRYIEKIRSWAEAGKLGPILRLFAFPGMAKDLRAELPKPAERS